ncbi:PREDICTED: MICOS complex subunit Mic19-like isoform X2 [Branchiostoma belcheri]|uniref:MICOS complex subunit Mic19-like isoform X2 n=1 Tax=Branchiostoma belcheri TaxID=7741 RepID=A0A6P4ZFJ2_BRABE|nr:PREDICTED: MICOS complex subunit Mic19-like isoform X2 [Branchiostoma belcheri]
MGGSQSTRKVTLEQGDMEGVVKVSASVVKRMRGEPEDEPSSTGAPPLEPEAGRSRDGIPRETLLPHEQKAVLHEAIQERDRYWQDKLQSVEEKNAQLNQLTVEQFHKAAEEVEAKFIKQHYKPVCQDLQEAVMTCYIENPKQTLNCAQQTKAFTSCVENARLSMLQLKASS